MYGGLVCVRVAVCHMRDRARVLHKCLSFPWMSVSLRSGSATPGDLSDRTRVQLRVRGRCSTYEGHVDKATPQRMAEAVAEAALRLDEEGQSVADNEPHCVQDLARQGNDLDAQIEKFFDDVLIDDIKQTPVRSQPRGCSRRADAESAIARSCGVAARDDGECARGATRPHRASAANQGSRPRDAAGAHTRARAGGRRECASASLTVVPRARFSTGGAGEGGAGPRAA